MNYYNTKLEVLHFNQDRCNKCGRDYTQCACVKFIDENVFDEVVEADLIGLIWTNRNAFYSDG